MKIIKVNIDCEISEIEKVDEQYNDYDSLYEFIMEGAEGGELLIIDDKIAYISDIRADYLNHELYVPMFNCDVIQGDNCSVTYNNRMEKEIIHSFDKGYTEKDVYILPSILARKAYKVDIRKLKLSASNPNRSARDLFNRYIGSSYWKEEEDDCFRHTIVQKKQITKKQRQLLVDNGLHFYGETSSMDYRDVRNWKLEVLSSQLGDAELSLGEQWYIRKLKFEAELYTRLFDRIYWDGWTFGTFDMLIGNKYDYIKYKENGVYLIFKYRWLRGKEV